MKRLLTAILLLMAMVLLPGTVAAQVRGQVTDAASGDAIAGALVWLNGRTIHMVRSGSDGSYAFANAPAGSYCIRVDSPGYEGAGVCISVTANASMIVDLPMTVRPLVMAPLVVSGRRGAVGMVTESIADSLRPALSAQDLVMVGARTSALAGAQLGDLMHTGSPATPGGGRPHTLYVWGSSAERGRVLLDGASLNAPLHLGALLPPLDPNMIAGADVHSGGISPRYDGGTSYIMDFTTRPAADEAAVWGELDLLAGHIGAETPIDGRGRIVMSARRVNDEVIDGLVSSKFGYGYVDALARADLDLGDTQDLHLTVLTTREAVSIPRDLSEDRAAWDNRAATLVWERENSGNGASAVLSMSRGVADLPLLSAVGGHLVASLDRYSGMAQRHWSSGGLDWNTGAEFEHLVFRRRSSAAVDPLTGTPGLVECTAALPCSHSSATFASAFGEIALSPARTMRTSIGARAMYDVDGQHLHILPRASITLLPARQYSITIAGGRFSQAYVRETPPASDRARVDLPVEVDVARATHLEVSVARSAGSSYIRAGAYLRHHGRVEPTRRRRTVPGADVALEYGTRLGTLALGYSISGAAYAARDDTAQNAPVQQLVTAGFSGSHGRFTLDLSGAWGTGLPLTSIVLEQPVEAEILLQPGSPFGSQSVGAARSRSYLRLDASLGAEWHLANGVRLTPYARIINPLGQRESLFYFQDRNLAHPPRGLARLPAVPMIGLRWHF